MRLLLAILIVVIGFSCHSGGNGTLSSADSLVVQFNQPGTDLIDKTVTSTEHNAISEVSQFTTGKEISSKECTLDGNILFYKGEELVGDVSFNYSADSCRQFIQKSGDKTKATVLSNKAADFLRSLREGRGSY